MACDEARSFGGGPTGWSRHKVLHGRAFLPHEKPNQYNGTLTSFGFWHYPLPHRIISLKSDYVVRQSPWKLKLLRIWPTFLFIVCFGLRRAPVRSNGFDAHNRATEGNSDASSAGLVWVWRSCRRFLLVQPRTIFRRWSRLLESNLELRWSYPPNHKPPMNGAGHLPIVKDSMCPFWHSSVLWQFVLHSNFSALPNSCAYNA